MEEKKPDRRVLKTKKAIRNALAQLLAEKELEEITVKEVADTADINRKTFYNYYAGVHQVIDEIENEIISTFDQAIREVDACRDIKNPYTFFEKITAIFNQDLGFLQPFVPHAREFEPILQDHHAAENENTEVLPPGTFLRPAGGGDLCGVRCVGNDGRV